MHDCHQADPPPSIAASDSNHKSVHPSLQSQRYQLGAWDIEATAEHGYCGDGGNREKLLLDSVDLFVEEGRKEFYGTIATAYRTGYLLYGPPGTGKSSCAMGIAGRTRRNVYVIPLLDKNMGHTTLLLLLHTIPEAAVILFEDVDSAGIGREAKVEEDIIGDLRHGDDVGMDDEDDGAEDKDPAIEEQKSMVTYSGLLNAIDGPLATEGGHIIVMTTNYREKLDDALIRDGRCNIELYLGHTTQAMAEAMFVRIMKASVDTYHPAGEPVASMDATERAATEADPDEDASDGEKQNGRCHTIEASALTSTQMLHGLAKQFAVNVPAETFTPAQLLTHLMRDIDGPKRAVNDFGAWEKRQYANREKREEEKLRVAEKRAAQLIERHEQASLRKDERRNRPAFGGMKQGTQGSKFGRGSRSSRARGGMGRGGGGGDYGANHCYDDSRGRGRGRGRGC